MNQKKNLKNYVNYGGNCFMILKLNGIHENQKEMLNERQMKMKVVE